MYQHGNIFIMLIDVKTPAIVGILTLMSMINFVLIRVEHEISFITPRTGKVYSSMLCY